MARDDGGKVPEHQSQFPRRSLSGARLAMIHQACLIVKYRMSHGQYSDAELQVIIVEAKGLVIPLSHEQDVPANKKAATDEVVPVLGDGNFTR